jgi:hypothetical protein
VLTVGRRSSALVALVGFLALTVVAIGVGGSRPGLQQGTAPTVVQFLGYGCALAGAVLLLIRPGAGGDRRAGGVVLGALAVLVALELAIDGGGANIGAGFLRLVCLVVVVVLTVRLARTVTAERRH